MSKFNPKTARPKIEHPVTTTGETTTYEGGKAYTRDVRSDLVLLAVTNMVGEDTFYESAESRDDRFAGLVRAVAVSHPEWMFRFITWLRSEANMRSASVVAAAESVHARLARRKALELSAGPDGAPMTDGWNRAMIDAACQRADEPGELLGYWTSKYGRTVPISVKRGLGDAAIRLYSEYTVLKYDTESHAVRFGDVLNLCHPGDAKGSAQHLRFPAQGDLFEHVLDRRHGNVDEIPASLAMIQHNGWLRKQATLSPRVMLDPAELKAAGMTWEDALSAVGSKLDKARLWESLIPTMGYMALLRNLRNFDEAGIRDEAVDNVIARLTDPEAVAKSRQFPYRFLSAYKAAPSHNYSRALDKALTLATGNIPKLSGKTLIMVDTSASMRETVSAKSVVRHVDVAALFGVALAARGADVDLVGFASGSFLHPLKRGGSVLRQSEEFIRRVGEVGHGTNTAEVLRSAYNGHARVVILHDGQYGNFSDAWRHGGLTDAVPANVPLFGVDTGGYSESSIDSSQRFRYEIGGFSDKLFTMVDLLSRGRSSSWPWEA